MSDANWIKGQRLWHVHTGEYRTLCGTHASCAESDKWPPGDLCAKCKTRLDAKLEAARSLLSRYDNAASGTVVNMNVSAPRVVDGRLIAAELERYVAAGGKINLR